MILCSCNALSHRDVDAAVEDGATRPAEIYAHCGKRAECGTCIRAILAYLRSETRIEGVAGGLSA